MISTIFRLLISIPGMPTYKAQHPRPTTATPIPTETTADEAISALLGAGLYRGALIVTGVAAIIVLFVWAWSKIER